MRRAGQAPGEPGTPCQRREGMPRTSQWTLPVVLLTVVLAGCVDGASGPAESSVTLPGQSPSAIAGASPSAEPSPSPAEGAPSGPLPSIGSGSGQASPGATIIVVPGPTPGHASPSTAPPTVAPLRLAGLRYALVDALGRPIFCDPDFYPVARADEAELAELRYPAIRADAVTYQAITAHLGIGAVAKPTAVQILAIYREWKMLRSLVLEPADTGYRFDYVAAAAPGPNQGWHVSGTIGATGTISLERRDPSGPPPCPICLARGTAIATPNGPVAVENLRAGMIVWTADEAGARVAARVLLVGSTPVPPTHLVVHLVLADGRVIDASPGHPLPDGRTLADLRSGDLVDGALVVTAELVPYAGGATYDLLPDGPTGTYWANGILLASTLHRPG